MPSDEQPAKEAGSAEAGEDLTNPLPPDPFRLDITDVLDLHTFQPKEIPAALEAYLEEARRKGFTSVRVIHGKGTGVQRERVRSVLSRTLFVARYQDAPGDAGGWGATVVWLGDAPDGRAESLA